MYVLVKTLEATIPIDLFRCGTPDVTMKRMKLSQMRRVCCSYYMRFDFARCGYYTYWCTVQV